MHKILVVDDEPQICRVLCDFLKKTGYEAVSAESGTLGLKILGEEQFDALISDLRMPFMDGIEFCRKAKRINPDLVILVLTGAGSLETAQEAIRIGVFDYLTKPVDLRRLKSIVDKGLKACEIKKKKVQYYAEIVEGVKNEKENLEDLKMQLMGLLGHELSTPVTIMSGSFQLLDDATKFLDPSVIDHLSEEKKNDLRSRFNEGQRWIVDVAESLNSFLSFCRDEVRLKKEKVNLNEFLERHFVNLDYIASLKHVKLTKEITDVPLLAEVDREKFLDVLSRLISNSALHNPTGTQVSIRLYPFSSKAAEVGQNEGAMIEISDNGGGIDAEVLRNIFKPLNVGNMMHHGRGIGLGLAISKKVIDLHGGKIKVASEKGKGTTVIIEIPLTKKDSVSGTSS